MTFQLKKKKSRGGKNLILGRIILGKQIAKQKYNSKLGKFVFKLFLPAGLFLCARVRHKMRGTQTIQPCYHFLVLLYSARKRPQLPTEREATLLFIPPSPLLLLEILKVQKVKL